MMLRILQETVLLYIEQDIPHVQAEFRKGDIKDHIAYTVCAGNQRIEENQFISIALKSD